jgi:Uma2 family endonuclease
MPERPIAKVELPLESGEHLDAVEFLRRYEAMPQVKKAELIQGIVYMGSPVNAEYHGEPDNIIQTWLGTYCGATPGIKCAANSTVRLGVRNVAQPDALLLILPEHGGKAQIDSEGYIIGSPELVVEVAASSSAIDAYEKRDAYAAAGAQEYLLWRTYDSAMDWWYLENGQYQLLPIDGAVIRSKVFPGLWLDWAALLHRNRAVVMTCLQRGLESDEHKAFVQALAARKRSDLTRSVPQ